MNKLLHGSIIETADWTQCWVNKARHQGTCAIQSHLGKVEKQARSSCCGSVVTNLTSIHEVWHRPQMQLRSRVAVAVVNLQLQLWFDPWPYAGGVALKSKKIKNKKQNKQTKSRQNTEFPGGLAVKDPVLSLLWLWSLLWHRFNFWSRNFWMPQAQPKKKKEAGNTNL